ncbi:unnamed protein product [Gordionus sp. m RMFG-2023]
MLLGDNNSLNIRDLDSIVIDYQKDDQILEIVLENEKSNPIIQVIPIVDVVDERSAVNLRQSRVQNMDSTLPFDISNYVQLDVVPKDFNILEILADESTDISGIEQMSLCARYLYSENDEVQIKEDFLQFIPIQDIRAISDCCSIPVILSTMGTIGKVYDMFKYPKRSNVLKNFLAKEEAIIIINL